MVFKNYNCMSSKKGVLYILWQIVLLVCVCMISGVGECVICFCYAFEWYICLMCSCLFIFLSCFPFYFWLFCSCASIACLFCICIYFLVVFVVFVFTSLFLTKTFSLLLGQSSSSSGLERVSRAPARQRPSFLKDFNNNKDKVWAIAVKEISKLIKIYLEGKVW